MTSLDISNLCPVAQEAARRFVKRLELGQATKGPWVLGEARSKPWRQEKQEEVLDFFVYDLIEEIEEEAANGL